MLRALALASLLVVSVPLGSTPSTAHAQDDRVAQARTLFTEGQRAYDAGRFEEAAEKMKAAYELTRSAELAFNVGRVYERMSAYEEAIRYFRIYLRQGSPDEAARADVQARISALQAAQRRQREQVFSAAPSNDELTQEARAFFLRGVAMYRRRQYEAAMQAFIAAHRFAPLPEVLYNLAVTAEKLGSRQDAIDYYREYLRGLPENAPDRGAIEREIRRLRGQ
ncbi:MAG: tetratricopeptide repeat protein [Sandaracinus sp.]|nr:tetratricopeptide repeat protein [Sandaracinus sp.]MCB9622147.1 tetratricopeptide repeat protein [Sandaracinus sp.]MCB9630561.1 tetratricopeptide repeat protein [Sandaracinus sp.]